MPVKHETGFGALQTNRRFQPGLEREQNPTAFLLQKNLFSLKRYKVSLPHRTIAANIKYRRVFCAGRKKKQKFFSGNSLLLYKRKEIYKYLFGGQILLSAFF
jgi:hypothetical protein